MVKQKSNIEIQQFEYSRTYGITAMEGRGFYSPADMAISKDRTAYVLNRGLETDERSVRVTMCNIDTEEYFKTFAFHGEGDGQVIWPVGIDLDSQGHVYISDEYLNRISVFDWVCVNVSWLILLSRDDRNRSYVSVSFFIILHLK